MIGQSGVSRPVWRMATTAILAGAAIAATAHGGTAAVPAAKPQPASAIAITNAEDIAPIDANRAIVSSMAGGELTSGALLLADRTSNEVRTLFPGADVAARPSIPGCDAPVHDAAFKPHGIALRTDSRGVRRLYVINHGARESVEMFRLDLSPQPRLTWTGCAIFPAGTFGNAVAIAKDGGFYATNQGRPLAGGDPVNAMGGEVVSWRADRGWAVVPRSAVPGANGLLLSPDEKTVFVAGWASRTLVAVPVDGTTPTRTLALPFMPDNLRWSPQGSILATGHDATPESVATCYMSASTICETPSFLAEVDAVRMAQLCGRPLAMGLGTVTVAMGPELWVGSARNHRIDRIPGPVCKPAA